MNGVKIKPPLCRLLDVQPGVTAIIGSGGKTTLIAKLCRELPGTVVVCTSTHIYPAEGMPFCEVLTERPGKAVCVGTPAEHGKLTAPRQSYEELARLADYVLVEADGSRGLPLKAHLDHEPVIPACVGQIIQAVGLSGMGKAIETAAHRPEQYARLCGCGVTDIATPERMAKVLNTEALADRYVLNQADDEEERKWGLTLQGLLHKPAIVISLLQPSKNFTNPY